MARTGYGSVSASFRIGKYEVTTAQYVDFLNNKAGSDPYELYDLKMADPVNELGCNIQRSGLPGNYSYSVAADWANRPANFVSYWDAARFVNWLSNGQGNGDTETGAYTLNGYTGEDGRWIQRNAGADWYLPGEDEWYKAAYYDAGRNGTGSPGYWEYATKSDAAPANDVLSTDPGNNANYYINSYSIGGPHWRTSVGELENSASAYGTFDQNGNVHEWNEGIPYQSVGSASRGLRGGSFEHSDHGLDLRASNRNGYGPANGHAYLGFRVAQVPEPSSIIVLAGGIVSLLCLRRREA